MNHVENIAFSLGLLNKEEVHFLSKLSEEELIYLHGLILAMGDSSYETGFEDGSDVGYSNGTRDGYEDGLKDADNE